MFVPVDAERLVIPFDGMMRQDDKTEPCNGVGIFASSAGNSSVQMGLGHGSFLSRCQCKKRNEPHPWRERFVKKPNI